MNQSETDLGIVNESQLLGFGISRHCERSEAIHSFLAWRDGLLRRLRSSQ
jgi:hypothetical protein